MHKPLAEPFELCRTWLTAGCLGKVRVHAAIPAAESLNAVTGIVVPNVIALTGRAYESTGTASQTSLGKSCPLIGAEQFHQLISAELIGREILQGQLFQNLSGCVLRSICCIVSSILQHRQSSKKCLTLSVFAFR